MKVCILIPAHNEAEGIAATLQSCKGTDIFVVDDSSTDDTAKIAKRYTKNVLSVARGGKGQAIRELIKKYNICKKYDAFIMLDGDSILAPTAVAEFTKALKPGVAGAVGNMRNEAAGPFAAWRAVQYLQVFLLYRKGMEAINCINVMCGTCSIWSTELFKQLSWHDSPVEDMDWTYQLHRKKIGRVAYAAKADVFTSEPLSLRDYINQMLRWTRGYWLTTARYKSPLGRQALDAGQALLMLDTCFNWARLLFLPTIVFLPSTRLLEMSYGIDFLVMTGFTLVAAIKWRRLQTLMWLPVFPFMLLLDSCLNLFSFLTYRKLTSGIWISPQRKERAILCTD